MLSSVVFPGARGSGHLLEVLQMVDINVTVNKLRGREDAESAYCCMMEIPTPWPEALCMCRDWVTHNLGKYVEGYHLKLPSGEVVGHLYYAPAEQALFPYKVESGAAVLYCDWVQRSYQGKGLGRRLFTTFIDDMQKQGVKGILVEATDQVGQMHYQHYTGRGFTTVHELDHSRLLYLPISQEQIHFQALAPKIHPRHGAPVEVVVINGYRCPFEVATHLILQQVIQEFGNQVTFQQAWLTPETLGEYGASRGIFINGRRKLYGGEPEAAIRQAIAEELD